MFCTLFFSFALCGLRPQGASYVFNLARKTAPVKKCGFLLVSTYNTYSTYGDFFKIRNPLPLLALTVFFLRG